MHCQGLALWFLFYLSLGEVCFYSFWLNFLWVAHLLNCLLLLLVWYFFVVISCGVTGLLEVFHALWGWPLIFGVSFRWLGIAIDGWLAHIGCLHAGLFEFWVVAFKVSTLCHYRLLNVDAFCLFMVAASWVLVCGCCCYRMISCGV